MITVDPNSKTPIYQQIVQSLKSLVMMSKLPAHEKLPSVRRMARQLHINPNTVQKAYSILKDENMIYSIAGKGDFVADNVSKIKQMKKQQLVDSLSLLAKEARDAGMWIEEIFTIIDDAYSGN